MYCVHGCDVLVEVGVAHEDVGAHCLQFRRYLRVHQLQVGEDVGLRDRAGGYWREVGGRDRVGDQLQETVEGDVHGIALSECSGFLVGLPYCVLKLLVEFLQQVLHGVALQRPLLVVEAIAAQEAEVSILHLLGDFLVLHFVRVGLQHDGHQCVGVSRVEVGEVRLREGQHLLLGPYLFPFHALVEGSQGGGTEAVKQLAEDVGGDFLHKSLIAGY